MRTRAAATDGAARLHPGRKRRTGGLLRSRHGFTLLEICIVLFIIVLLMGAMAPAIESAFVEQALRADSHQLALMVKTAMIQSNDQHRAYVIDFTPTSMALHPVGVSSDDSDASSANAAADESPAQPVQENIEVSRQLNKANALLLPDPDKPKGWLPVASATWLFLPGQLCPAPRVRMTRGESWIEMDFNALTGNVENEASYFP